MPHKEGRSHGGISGAAKRNLGLPDESNNRNVQPRVGAIQDQVSPIVSEKALEQPLVKPGGIRRAVGRVGRAIREVGLQPSAIATNLLTGGIDREKTITPAIRETEPRRIGSSILTEKRRPPGPMGPREPISVLRGTKPPAPDIDFTRGTAKEVAIARRARARALRKTGRGVRRGRRGIDIFSKAGELAATFASPEFRAQQAKARGAGVRRKGRRADIKNINDSINVLVKQLKEVPDVEGNEEERSGILTQINNLTAQRTKLFSGDGSNDAILNEATRFKKAGFSDEETRSILGRLGTVNAT